MNPRSKNYRMRAVGVLLCFLPVFVTLASLAASLGGSAAHGMKAVLAGQGCMAAAGFVSALNLYLAIIRPWLHFRRHGSMDSLRHVSGCPLIGDLLVILGCIFDFGDRSLAVSALGVVTFNTGGLPYFLIATWRDKELWDKP